MNPREFFCRLSLAKILCVAVGCAGFSAPTKVLVWDFSNGRQLEALNGGVWTPRKPVLDEQGCVYHVTGNRGLSMSVIIDDGRRFDFQSVADAYVTTQNNIVKTVDVASYGLSESEVIEHLKAMHKMWNGRAIGDIDKWRRENHNLSAHLTEIHKSTGPDDPSITAAIRYNFGGIDNKWFIMVTFFWHTP